MKKYILGIDLGSTNSAMAIVEGGEASILENAEGKMQVTVDEKGNT